MGIFWVKGGIHAKSSTIQPDLPSTSPAPPPPQILSLKTPKCPKSQKIVPGPAFL